MPPKLSLLCGLLVYINLLLRVCTQPVGCILDWEKNLLFPPYTYIRNCYLSIKYTVLVHPKGINIALYT